MTKLKRWFRNLLIEWLGIEKIRKDVVLLQHQSVIAFDIGCHEPTVIIIATQLGGGRVKIINCHRGMHLDEINRLMGELERLYGRHPLRIIDMPQFPELKRRITP